MDKIVQAENYLQISGMQGSIPIANRNTRMISISIVFDDAAGVSHMASFHCHPDHYNGVITSLRILKPVALPDMVPLCDPEEPDIEILEGNLRAARSTGELGPLDVERYLTHYGIPFTVKAKGAHTLYLLERCLFNPKHDAGEPSIIAASSGKSPLLYQCFHTSCKDKKWKDARQIISGDRPIAEFCVGFDPNWTPPK